MILIISYIGNDKNY